MNSIEYTHLYDNERPCLIVAGSRRKIAGGTCVDVVFQPRPSHTTTAATVNAEHVRPLWRSVAFDRAMKKRAQGGTRKGAGRPRADDKADNVIMFRLDDAQLAEAKKVAKRMGATSVHAYAKLLLVDTFETRKELRDA